MRQYIAIDLKSFYASVECMERGLDPLTARLVVADPTRTDKTICLAVSPALKSLLGIGGRPRLFEVRQRARGCDFIIAPPRMALYIEYSTRIYQVYLRYIAPEDIHVYSIDEVFIDATPYLSTYKMTAHELAMKMIRDVLAKTGITATAGIGTNLYLCKIAMDIVAKKMPPDKDGVRIAELDEMTYRRNLWAHRPLTDFWRVGNGIAARLSRYGIYTMGDIARCSLRYEDLLYQLLGVNAELLIDHAWGCEPVSMSEIKSYRPSTHSISSGQVLQSPYTYDKARIVVMEMADALSLDLLDKRLLTRQVVLEVGYDSESLTRPEIRSVYTGRITTDHYGREVPFHGHASHSFDVPTMSARTIMDSFVHLYDKAIDPRLLIRRLTLSACLLEHESLVKPVEKPQQLDLFTDYEQLEQERKEKEVEAARERRRREAVLKIKKRFGKNAILTGLNFAEGATQRDRNRQIGGHHE
ncbi:MAG: DNA methylase [Muribaculaceae bacterium]|nr:DNA methylase [Muribaculaceae bacterium]